MSTQAIIERYAPLFMPKTVAVAGASTKGAGLPNIFIRRIREFGFEGAIYPIHPTAAAIDGLPAYRTLADTPQPVDYAYIAVAAAQIPAMLAASAGRVRHAQVISSGFGEVEAGKQLQQQLAAAARAGGMRLLGPNCLVYSAFIRSEGSSRQIAVHGMIGAWLRSSGSQFSFSRMPLGSRFFCSDRTNRSKRRIYSFAGSWVYSKSAVLSHGGWMPQRESAWLSCQGCSIGGMRCL